MAVVFQHWPKLGPLAVDAGRQFSKKAVDKCLPEIYSAWQILLKYLQD